MIDRARDKDGERAGAESRGRAPQHNPLAEAQTIESRLFLYGLARIEVSRSVIANAVLTPVRARVEPAWGDSSRLAAPAAACLMYLCSSLEKLRDALRTWLRRRLVISISYFCSDTRIFQKIQIDA